MKKTHIIILIAIALTSAILFVFATIQETEDTITLLTSQNKFQILDGVDRVLAEHKRGTLKDTDKIIRLLEVLTSSSDISIRNQAVCTLGNLGSCSKPSTDTLIKIVNTAPEKLVRNTAIIALGQIGENLDKVIPCLIETVERDNDSAMNVFMALGELGPKGKDALPFIEKYIAQNSKSSGIDLGYANFAYTQITGKSYAPTRRQ